MTTFSKWTPSNCQVRVYVNNLPCTSRFTKIWIEACPVDQFGFDYTIRAQDSNKNRSELGNLINDAEAALFEAAGSRIKTFADVLALAS